MAASSSSVSATAASFIVGHKAVSTTTPLCFLRSPNLPWSPPPHLHHHHHPLLLLRRCASSSGAQGVSAVEGDGEWGSRLPDKKKPLYSHSLPCIELWLKALGFFQSKDDRAVWFVHNLDWHAQLSLDVTDLYIRYLKSGPGNLEKDVERRFSYALSREDIENAILGGP